MEQISLYDGTHRLQIDRPVRLIELFAGIGAQAKALERLCVDFEHYRICELDENAVKSYNAIHGTAFLPSDVSKITAVDLSIRETEKYTYILTYSFPCQDLSNAGRKIGGMHGKRSGLVWEVERLLNECDELPQVLLMENVPDIINQLNAKDFGVWLSVLENMGYRNYYKICNAQDYDLPQNRKRCFMVSVLGDYYYSFPAPKPLTRKVRDLFDDSRRKMADDNEARRNLIAETWNDLAHVRQQTRKGYTVLKNYGCVSLAYPKSLSCRGRVIKGGDVCPAVACVDRELHKFIDGEFYKLSVLEEWRIMGFDDADFHKCKAAGISDTNLHNQAGNSIAVDVLEAIFGEMF